MKYSPLFSLRDVQLVYRALPALKHISWQAQTGEQWACLGPNGAGKTTLLTHVEAALEKRSVDFGRYYFAPGFLKRYRPSGTPAITPNPHEGRQYGPGLVLLKILLMLFPNSSISIVENRNTLIC